jgi:hypothetical protein
MDVNIKKILDNKKSPIQKCFESLNLRDNYTIPSSIEYMSFVRKQTPRLILENSKLVFSEPRSGADFMLAVIKSNDLTVDQLQSQKSSINNYLKTAVGKGYNNPEHFRALKECIEFIDKEIQRKSSLKYLKEDTVYNLHKDFLPQITLESSTIDELDKIIQNINQEPEMADEYEKFIKEIKSWSAKVTAKNFVSIIVKNTTLVLGLTVALTGSIIVSIISVPILMVSNLLKDKIDKKYINSYIAVINKEIQKVQAAIDDSTDDNNKVVLQNYLTSLQQAKNKLEKCKETKIPSKKPVKKITREGITEMEPEVCDDFNPDNCDDFDDAYKCKSFDPDNQVSSEDYLALCDYLDEGNIYPEELDNEDESKDDDNDDEDDDCDDDNDDEDDDLSDDIDNDLDLIEHEFMINFIDLFSDEEDEEVDLESFNNLLRLANKYDYIIAKEDLNKVVKNVANGVEKTVRGMVHGIRKAQDAAQPVKQAIQNIPSSFDNLVNNTLGKIQKLDQGERRRRIIEGGFKFKLYKLIQQAVAIGVSYAINPALAAITLIANVAVDTTLDEKERRKILHEMENELIIVNEKIEDSRGDESKQKKYELMRIKNKLEDDIARIKYRLG